MTRNDLSKGGKETPRGRAFPLLFAIIVAGGSGLRAGGGIPKQFHDFRGLPVFRHAVDRFLAVNSSTRIVIVTHSDYIGLVEEWRREAGQDWTIVAGGRNRWESVRKGLDAISAEEGLVSVHDAARPLVTEEMIRRGWEEAALHGAAVPVVPVTDSLRRTVGGESEAVDRSLYRAVQTPQVFTLALLREAYGLPYRDEFTDDASVVEAFGHVVALFPGDVRNMKITNPADFRIAEVLADF